MSTLKFHGFHSGDYVDLSITASAQTFDASIPSWQQSHQRHEISAPDNRICHVDLAAPLQPYAPAPDIQGTPEGALALFPQKGKETRYIVRVGDETAPLHHDEIILQPEADSTPLLGFGLGREHYMLPVDPATDRIVADPGKVHRKIYIATDGMDAAAIAADAGVSEGTVTTTWLKAHPEYGSTEATALVEGLGVSLFRSLTMYKRTSHWLLAKRGQTFTQMPMVRAIQGESLRHPVVITAWGTGAKPIFTQGLVLKYSKSDSRNAHTVLIQDVEYYGTTFTGPQDHFIFDHVVIDGMKDPGTPAFELQGYSHDFMRGITVRGGRFYDSHIPQGKYPTVGWDNKTTRISLMYCTNVSGMLVEDSLFDRGGWHPDYNRADPTNPAGPQAPSQYSHSLYIQDTPNDLTFRRNIISRGALNGIQMRCGAFFEDNFMAGNSVGFYYNKGRNSAGNLTLANGNVVTAPSGHHMAGIGWSMIGVATTHSPYSTLINTACIHNVDPNNPSDANGKVFGLGGIQSVTTYPTYEGGLKVVSYNWKDHKGDSTDYGIEGLDQNALNQTTIQNYTANQLGLSTDIEDFYTYARGQDGMRPLVGDLLRYFLTPCRLDPLPIQRTTAGPTGFVPNHLGDGLRWDNRLNWSTGDLPISGDSVDLGSCQVFFGGLTLDVATLTNTAQFTVSSGQLTAQSASLADVHIEGSGDLIVHTGGLSGALHLAGNGRLKMGATVVAQTTGLTLTLESRKGYPECEGGLVDITNVPLQVDLTDFTETQAHVPGQFTGQPSALSANGLGEQDLTVTIATDGLTLSVAPGTGQVSLA